MDATYSSHMEKLSSNMEKLTSSISDGFAMLRNIMGLPSVAIELQYMPPPPPQANYIFHNTSQFRTPASTSTAGQLSYPQTMYSPEKNMF